MRSEQIRLATKDQSLVQQLVDVGQISEAEAETHMFRNVILQALGAQTELTPVTGAFSFARATCCCFAVTGFPANCATKRFSRSWRQSRTTWPQPAMR